MASNLNGTSKRKKDDKHPILTANLFLIVTYVFRDLTAAARCGRETDNR